MSKKLQTALSTILTLCLVIGIYTTPVKAADTMEGVLTEAGYPNILYQSSDVEYARALIAYERSCSVQSTEEIYGCIIAPSDYQMKVEILVNGNSIINQTISTIDWTESNGLYIMPIQLYPSVAGTGYYTFRFTFGEDTQFLFCLGQKESTDTKPEEPAIKVPSVKVSTVSPKYSGTSFTGTLKEYPSGIDGVEYKVYTKGGKEVYQSTTRDTTLYIYGTDTRQIYYVRARAYVYDDDLNKVYSSWSAKKYFISSPSIKLSSTRDTIKKNSVTIKWSKVTGATKYKVYCSTKSDSGYKLVGTTTKTSLKVTKFKGKKISLTNKKYFKVVAITTVNGNTIRSTPYECVSCQYYVY